MYQENIIKIINKIRLEYANINSQLKWEMCKIEIREFSQKYSKHKQKIKNQYFHKLQQEFSIINKMVDENPVKENIQELGRIKKKLEQLYKDKCRGIFVRSREKWIEEGEKSSKYFLKLETQNGKTNYISAVLKKDKVIVDDKRILEEIYLYYSKLYCSEKSSNFDDGIFTKFGLCYFR